MKHRIVFAALSVLAFAFSGNAFAKLPEPTDAQKAEAEAKKAKADEAAAKAEAALAAAQDKVAESWAQMQSLLANPLMIGLHVFFLASVIFVLVKFFSLFPKAQPARIGPLKPPPQPVLSAMLYGAWIGITVALSAVLAGVIF